MFVILEAHSRHSPFLLFFKREFHRGGRALTSEMCEKNTIKCPVVELACDDALQQCNFVQGHESILPRHRRITFRLIRQGNTRMVLRIFLKKFLHCYMPWGFCRV